MNKARDHREAELKFDLDSKAARKVRHHPLLADTDPKTQSLTSQYFDTGNGKVHGAGYSLRVRRDGDRYTQTVKSAGGAGMFDRGEWEAPVDQMAVDSKALQQTPLGELNIVENKLEPQVRSEVERATWLIDRDGSLIEVALDTGTVSSDGATEKFQELELELKAGEAVALYDLARELGQDVSLEIGVLSKEDRGRRLANNGPEREQKALEPEIGKDMAVGQAFAVIVQECIRHFRLNQSLIITERDPDALHQARVAMRRLRTAFRLFRPAIRRKSLEPLKSKLRDFLKPFGTARNLDVYLANHGEELSRHDREKLKSARSGAYDQVIDALQSQRTRDMLVDLVEWTASDEWRKRVAADPIGEFAAKRLDQAWKKVRHGGSNVCDLKDKRLHRLRIDIKELRYSVEFLASLYRRKKVRNFASSLEAMQECLGLIHDDIMSREIVAHYELDYAGRIDAAARLRQLGALDSRLKRLNKADPCWR